MKIVYVYNRLTLEQTARASHHSVEERLEWYTTVANFVRELNDEIEAGLDQLFTDGIAHAVDANDREIEVVVESENESEHFTRGVSVLYEAGVDYEAGADAPATRRPIIDAAATPEPIVRLVTEAVSKLLAHPERWASWRQNPRFSCFYCRLPIEPTSPCVVIEGAIKHWRPDPMELAEIHLHDACRAPFAHRLAGNGT